MRCALDISSEIRRALPHDAAAIGEICVASARRAYKGICADSHLEALSPVVMGRLWLRENCGHLVVDDPNIAVFLAVKEQQTIGFADIGPARFAGHGRVAELFAIYLNPAHIGQGWGTALFKASVVHARERGFTALESKVFSLNRLARNFYERQGGKSVAESEVELDAGGARAKLITYRWEKLPI